MRSLQVEVKGLVQAVGFRPFVYQLAHQWNLRGWVCNNAEGVVIVVEGTHSDMEAFLQDLTTKAPPLSRIDQVNLSEQEWKRYTEFTIRPSQEGQARLAPVPPDIAICPQCHEDLCNKGSRYYHYPFTNCTNCGSRYTIIETFPYDRPRTAMASFAMCLACRQEYMDPLNRRFHAQPIACPTCGPHLWMSDRQGRPLQGAWQENFHKRIRGGQIVAVKSLGGFHLVCDGRNATAITTLRQRKKRPHQPFAVMGQGIKVVQALCLLCDEEEKMLTGPQSPIVVLEQRRDIAQQLPSIDLLAPGVKTLGMMTPYTPLHFLLFADDVDVLVMTSGNLSGFPLARTEEEALEQLSSIADAFLFHNRPIVSRADDSVLRLIDGSWHLYRRSRGFVPVSLPLPAPSATPLQSASMLAVGGDMKNTFALVKDGEAVLSQHMGTLHTREGEKNYLESLTHLQKLLDLEPASITCDGHPHYHSVHLAHRLSKPLLTVQHHHGHFAATMADHGCTQPCIGVIMDGTGYGDDGTIWGFEIMTGDLQSYQRHYALRPVPLPGGERAVKKPYITAAAFLGEAFGDPGWEKAKELFPAEAKEIALARLLVQQKLNSPLVSSAGRFLDALSALLGICKESTYDGQAAIELGEAPSYRLGLAGRKAHNHEIEETLALGSYPFLLPQDASLYFDYSPVLTGLLEDLEKGVDRSILASRLHNSFALLIREAVCKVAQKEKRSTVALGGGVFQNPYLFTLVHYLLRQEGLQVLWPQRVPANDGGLSYGQAAIAYWHHQQVNEEKAGVEDVSSSTFKNHSN
ncbi:carbamoyltransferase HypF [Heliorestis convoluta]|uniref:Carbamoyltransferase n=1 Tax=Heliorestis convoluta TaxID=356322 RepID=A0A5Q2MZP6_9FIRM|nr:carbamoyltransferase HypF [Heliorestis convoluta]QGG48464.1 hydrogenase maturation protein HypF [Heliorestis convoluta]